MPSKEPTPLAYIELPAEDFAVIEAFYAEAFGWTFQAFGSDYLAFKSGLCEGGFYKSALQSRSDKGAALPVLQTEQLDGLAILVVEAGGKISKEIFYFPGGRRFHFLDPHGNELAVWSSRDRNGSPIAYVE